MKDNFSQDDRTQTEMDRVHRDSTNRDTGADDRRAILPGQIRHLLENGYFLACDCGSGKLALAR